MGLRILQQQTLQRVVHDKTLDGDGTPQAPLGVTDGSFLTTSSSPTLTGDWTFTQPITVDPIRIRPATTSQFQNTVGPPGGVIDFDFPNLSGSDFAFVRLFPSTPGPGIRSFDIFADGTVIFRVHNNLGTIVGNPTGLGQGPGTINAEEVYDNGQRVLTADVYQSAVVELGGDFNAGEEVKCVRIGDQVTITGVGANLAHTSSDTTTSSAGVIPAAFRPTETTSNSYRQIATTFCDVSALSDGTFRTLYRDSSGSGVSRTNTGWPPSITYNIT